MGELPEALVEKIKLQAGSERQPSSFMLHVVMAGLLLQFLF